MMDVLNEADTQYRVVRTAGRGLGMAWQTGVCNKTLDGSGEDADTSVLHVGWVQTKLLPVVPRECSGLSLQGLGQASSFDQV